MEKPKRELVFISYLTLWNLTPYGFYCSLIQSLWQFYASIKYKKLLKNLVVNGYLQKTTYLAPFIGCWYVAQGGLTPKDSHAWGLPHQRYAYDFLIINDEGKSYKTSGNKLSDYYAYGKPIIAPANGVVVEARDDTPDNPPWRINLKGVKDLRGNYIVIKHADSEYTMIAHLKKGSIKVRIGEYVKRGQVIAECGNSGISSEPHIHFQVQNKRDFYSCITLPIKLTYVDDRGIHEGYLRKGLRICNQLNNSKLGHL